MSFHPRAGICDGVSADRPRSASIDLRSPVARLASPDRRRANPSAISGALNPIAHKGARSDDITPTVPDRCTSLVLMRLLHSTRILPTGLLPHPFIDARGKTRDGVAGILQAEFLGQSCGGTRLPGPRARSVRTDRLLGPASFRRVALPMFRIAGRGPDGVFARVPRFGFPWSLLHLAL